MKQTKDKKDVISRGVSTLDVFCKVLKTSLPGLLLVIALSSLTFARPGHSILDLVDPSFNPNVQSGAYSFKWVNAIQVLPDGKILALGGFTTYNGVPVGKLIRLNADASLDTTFNNQTITNASSFQSNARILLQPDGKIIVKCGGLVAGGQEPRQILRLNADGTFDPTFNFTQTNFIFNIVMDSLGRITIHGDFTTPQGPRRIIRLSGDGSIDASFDLVGNAGIAVQGERLIVSTSGTKGVKISRLNDDGSEDTTFTPFIGPISLMGVQPGNKIIYQRNISNTITLLRLNENGGNDETFEPTALTQGLDPSLLKFTDDGKMVITSSSSSAPFRRFLADGGVDPSFTPYTATDAASYTILPDDSIIIGDGRMGGAPPSFSNNFIKLAPDGLPDPTFNPGGTGFQNVLPGVIQSIDTYSDGRVLLGGKFDLINGETRYRMVRLNADSTIDESFEINNTSGTGNYFSIIRDVYQASHQSDGKIVVSGFFDYVLNGVTKQNLVRLNSDGSIDDTFNLTYAIPDWSQIIIGGQNRFAILNDGKLMVGTSRANNQPDRPGPIKFAESGDRDTSFNSMLNSTSSSMYIDDVVIQPDGKIIASGSHAISSVFKSFVVRFNTDGSLDSTFPYTEEPNRLKSRLVLLPSGKILITKSRHPEGGSARIQRLNPDGSIDTSFNSQLLADNTAKFNALLSLPNGKIFIGGKFTLTVNGQPGKNLLQLDEDGNFEPTTYIVNEEVFALAADNEGRVLVGGSFTVIGANGSGETRSFVARLTDSRVRFDFDGDGRADIGVFNNTNGNWSILKSRTDEVISTQFGLSDDKIAPADYDGDGKIDIAVYRPTEGIWYLLKSQEGFAAIRWGVAEDRPVPADYDGDGNADFAVWRPSEAVWYILQSSDNQVSVIQFGLADDIPLTSADFDGDGKADIAVWRPSDGNFYWLESGSNNNFRIVHFGQSGDIPTVADYNGDGKSDLSVFRPTDGNWYQYLSTPTGEYGFSVIKFGVSGDEPIPADYDGDGKADIAVRRGNIWHILKSSQGYVSSVFADVNDTAIASSPNQ